MLRETGTPRVFWDDLFGTPETSDLPVVAELPLLMAMRHTLTHGPQYDAFNVPDVVGFVHESGDAHPGSGPTAVLSDRLAGAECLCISARYAGRRWVSVVGGHEPVVVGDDDVIELSMSDGGLSVYVPESVRPILDGVEEYRLRMGNGN